MQTGGCALSRTERIGARIWYFQRLTYGQFSVVESGIMLRAQCLICTELFEANSDIAALFCGHTFHDRCLMQWIEQSNANKATCPQCRQSVSLKKIIHHLYFSQVSKAHE